jgi:hypothetical protein
VPLIVGLFGGAGIAVAQEADPGPAKRDPLELPHRFHQPAKAAWLSGALTSRKPADHWRDECCLHALRQGFRGRQAFPILALLP